MIQNLLAPVSSKRLVQVWGSNKTGYVMGSTGGGRFSDYTGNTDDDQGKPMSGSGGGGTDQCGHQIKDVVLEEVERSEYWKAHKRTPSAGTNVHVKATLVGGRLAIETSSKAEVIGYLPTRYNYIVQCMKRGFTYAGAVTATSTAPIVKVIISLDPPP